MTGSIQILNSDNWYLGSIENLVNKVLTTKEQLFIITANLETVAKCNKDKEFLDICLSADIIIPDGIGAVLLLKRIGKNVAEKIPGYELATKLIIKSEKTTKVFLFGSTNDVLEKTSKRIGGNVSVVGAISGYDYVSDEVTKRISQSEAEMLFVALGIPKQEQWISENRDKLSDVNVLIGVGGTFDVWSGTKKRAPKWICKIGFEWLWRILSEPFARIPRFMKSFGIFVRIMILGK